MKLFEVEGLLAHLDGLDAASLDALFHRLDGLGRGEALGAELDTVDRAVRRAGFHVVSVRQTATGPLVIARRRDDIVLVRDDCGPWLVPVVVEDVVPDMDERVWLEPWSPTLSDALGAARA